MLHIVNAYSEAVIAKEESARDALGLLEEHGRFRPEEALKQIPGPMMHGGFEFDHIRAVQQVFEFGKTLQSNQHPLRRHHESQQGGGTGFPIEHIVQMAHAVVQAEAKIPLLRPV